MNNYIIKVILSAMEFVDMLVALVEWARPKLQLGMR